MRYFCYNSVYDIEQNGAEIVTVSEQEIRDQEWYAWQRRKSWKEGTDYVNETYCFQDCLDEWIIVNKAWESTNE